MKKSEWVKLLAHEGIRLVVMIAAALILYQIFRKKGDNAKAAVVTAATVANGVPAI